MSGVEVNIKFQPVLTNASSQYRSTTCVKKSDGIMQG
jgi:hypothetical protein